MGLGPQNLQNILGIYLPTLSGTVASTPAPTTTTCTLSGVTLANGAVVGASVVIGSAFTVITANTGNAITFTALASAPSAGATVTIHAIGGSLANVDVTITASSILLPVQLQAAYQPAADSTTATLAASAVYTGTAFDLTNARGILVTILADEAGVLQVQQSPDGTNWDTVDQLTYPGGSEGLKFTVPVVSPISSAGRLVYTNGATAQGTMRLYARTTPQPVERTTQLPTALATTGSITTGGTAQSLFGSAAWRRLFLIQNPSTATGQGITAAESLWITFGGTATTAPPSIEVVTGALIILDTVVDPQSISIIAATTGHAFTARQA